MSVYLFVIGFTFTVGIYGLAAAIAQAAARRWPTAVTDDEPIVDPAGDLTYQAMCFERWEKSL